MMKNVLHEIQQQYTSRDSIKSVSLAVRRRRRLGMSSQTHDNTKIKRVTYSDSIKIVDIPKDKKQSFATLTAMASTSALSHYQEEPTSRSNSKSYAAPKKLVSAMFNRDATSGEDLVTIETRGHVFVNYTFKRAAFCDVCQRLVVDYQREGLRCKTCKSDIHKHCVERIGCCTGRMLVGSSGGRRSSDSNRGSVKEVTIDADYQILAEGKDLRLGGADQKEKGQNAATETSDSSDPSSTTYLQLPKVDTSARSPTGKKKNSESANTYIALYKFRAQVQDDLTLKPGDKIRRVEEEDQSWWTGEHNGRRGFFPSNFVAKIEAREKVYLVKEPTSVMDDNGNNVSLKKNQVIFINPISSISKQNHLRWRIGSQEGFIASTYVTPV